MIDLHISWTGPVESWTDVTVILINLSVCTRWWHYGECFFIEVWSLSTFLFDQNKI